MNAKKRKENRLHWYVMKCQDAERIEAFIDEYNNDEAVVPDNKVEDLFIPSLAIRRRVVQRGATDKYEVGHSLAAEDTDVKNNKMRNVLRRFVFLYVRPSAFDRLEHHLPTQYWNTGSTQLRHYRDGEGNEITVDNEKMSIFISGCLEFLEKFEIHAKDSQLAEGVQVTVRNGSFKDFQAEVYNIHYKSSGIRFSIAIKFFANDRYIHIHNCRPEDVVLSDEQSPVFSADFIDRIQSNILSILRRQVHKNETAQSREADRRQLQQLYYLRHAIIDDPFIQVQLDSLMSICASLSKNNVEKSKYNKIVKQHIKGLRNQEASMQQQTALAYLLTALYISTKDARYRTELKQIVMDKLPANGTLREFLSLIRN